MRIYLAVSSGSGRLPPALAQAATRSAELVLGADSGPWRASEWRSRGDGARLLAWSNEPDDPCLLAPLVGDDERALGCPGYLGDPGDAERLVRSGDPGALADELSGSFSLFRADQQGFVAITIAARVHPVYFATAGDLQLAGNSASLLHLVARAAERGWDARPSIRYDVPALHSLVQNGFFLSDDTPFDGVQALPAHSTLEVSGGARRIVARPLPSADPGIPSPRAARALTADLVDSVVAAVAPLRAFSEPITLFLSGGRDSRLIAAALHAAEVPFRAMSRGLPGHPDVVLGSRIAGLLGVEHRITVPPRNRAGDALVVKHPLLRTWELLRSTEGMVSAHNNVSRPARFRIAPTVSGWGGEQLRGGYLTASRRSDLSDAQLARRVRNLYTEFDGLLTDAAREREQADLAPWAQHAERDAPDALDRIYLYYRVGRWLAAYRAAADASHVPFHPLLDNRLIRRALAMSPRWRWSEQPFHQAISRLAPQLRDLPITGKRWRYEAEKPPWWRPGRRGWSSRGALLVEDEPAGFDWRFQPDPSLTRLLREHILDGPAQLFDLVARHKIEGLLSKQPLEQPKAVWQVYTASVLLSGLWLSARPETRPISVSMPTQSSLG